MLLKPEPIEVIRMMMVAEVDLMMEVEKEKEQALILVDLVILDSKESKL